jgi:hypothetical protein
MGCANLRLHNVSSVRLSKRRRALQLMWKTPTYNALLDSGMNTDYFWDCDFPVLCFLHDLAHELKSDSFEDFFREAVKRRHGQINPKMINFWGPSILDAATNKRSRLI